METQHKQGYKQTEVGLIPEEWEVKFLGDLGTFSKGSGVRKDQSNSGSIPCIRYGEIYTKHHDYIKKFYSFISEEVAKGAAGLKKGDILFAGSGETKSEIGKSVAFVDDFHAYAGGDIVILSPRNVDSLFLGYLSNAPIIQNQKAKRGQGDAVVHISSGQLSSILIPLPPLPEQTAIASALSDMDALIAQTEKLIEKKKAIKQGVMQELLTGKKRLKGFENSKGYKQTEVGVIPEDWEVLSIDNIFDFYSTSNYSKAEMFLEGEVGCIHYGLIHAISDTSYNLQRGIKFFIKPEQAKYEEIKDGDVVMVDASEDMEGVNKSIEVFGVNNKRFIAGLHTYLLRDNKLRLAYNFRGAVLNSSLIKNQLNRLAVGMKVFGVSKPQLKTVLIPVPPLPEQTAIASALSDIDEDIRIRETKLQKLKLQKQGMMQALLTGKIRLV